MAVDTMTWCDAIGGLHRTWLTGDALPVLVQLAGCMASGEDNPTHARLAGLAKCSVRTVQRTLNAARATGFLAWLPVFRLTANGRRRAANQYRLLLPAGAIPPRPKRPREPNRQGVRAVGFKILKQGAMASFAAARELATVRDLMQRRMLERFRARKNPAGANAPAG